MMSQSIRSPRAFASFWHERPSLRSDARDRGVAVFRCRLHSTELDELGEFSTLVPNWSVGDTFTTDDGRRFLILKIAPLGEPDDALITAMWMVEPVEGEPAEWWGGRSRWE
jgi:hypothetical protein